MSRRDGGPAFPTWPEDFYQGSAIGPGMSLRDYFAGQALASIPIRNWEHVGSEDKIIKTWAVTCYGIADAMLAARGDDA